jgi:hypothetical protein
MDNADLIIRVPNETMRPFSSDKMVSSNFISYTMITRNVKTMFKSSKIQLKSRIELANPLLG